MLEVILQLAAALVSAAATVIAAYITVSRAGSASGARRASSGRALIGGGSDRGKPNKDGIRGHPREVPHRPTEEPSDWSPVLALTILVLGWVVGGAIALPLGILVAHGPSSSGAMGGAFGWFSGAAFGGLIMGIAMRLASLEIKPRHLLKLSVGWATAGALGGAISWELSNLFGGLLGGATVGLVGGFITSSVIRGLVTLSTQQFITIMFGWMIGGAAAGASSFAYFGYFSLTIYIVAGCLIGGVAGLIGGSLMLLEIGGARRSV